MESVYQSFGALLTWLTSLDDIPAPLSITRLHMKKAACKPQPFLSYVNHLEIKARQKNRIVKMVETLFDEWTTDEESLAPFHNPIRWDLDRFGTPRNEIQHGTVRARIPDLTLDELKSFIVELTPSGEFRWSSHLSKIPNLWEETHDAVQVICPILPAIIFMMLTFPLRAHQSRWLDSGEYDEEIFDFMSMQFVTNTTGLKHRRSGVIQPADGNLQETEGQMLDFQVAVNKTALVDRKRSAFTIPFLPPEVLWVLQQVSEYQAAYGPPARLVKEVREPGLKRKRNQALAEYYPDICPLFRFRGNRSFYPPSHKQISRFWGALCAVWDDIHCSGESNLRGRPKLSRIRTGKKGYKTYFANFDLHSLRVAGVSRLLDAGLPLAVVAAIAGHKTLVMTLYYYKAEAQVLRLRLEEAFKKTGAALGIDVLVSQLQKSGEQPGLIGSPEALSRLELVRKNGLMSITTSGICPGTSCSNGLRPEFSDGSHSEVPKSRCPLCRFFIYGPPFLPGLIYDYNCHLFELQSNADQQVRIREKIMEAEDAGRQGEALRLRGEDDRLDRETALDIATLAQLYKIIDECLVALNEQPLDASSLQLISDGGRLGAVVEQVSKFAQLKELLEAAQVIPTTRHGAPRIADLEMRDLLLNMLRTNGAECYLAGLPSHVSQRATLQLARLMESAVPTEDLRQKLLEGFVSIDNFPELREGIAEQVRELDELMLTTSSACD
jgi:hypothetical protein